LPALVPSNVKGTVLIKSGAKPEGPNSEAAWSDLVRASAQDIADQIDKAFFRREGIGNVPERASKPSRAPLHSKD